MDYAITLEHIEEAAFRLQGLAHVTAVQTCATLDRLAGRELFFKCEHLQKGGAFKFRGACNAIARLAPDVASRGVVTHSSGNHAGALALAARARGIAAHVVMPSNSARVKMNAVREYGGNVILCEPNLAARESTAARVLAETGGTMIPPYDHPDVIAGQGTVARELQQQVPHLDAIIAPVGGGGLMAGICLAAPRLRIFAAEPAGADDAARSKAAGKIVLQTNPQTIADGLRTSLGELTWPILRDRVEDVLTVSEAEIVQAMRLCWERAKLLIEPSAAVAVAATLWKLSAHPEIQRVGIVLSGGNLDLDRLPWAEMSPQAS